MNQEIRRVKEPKLRVCGLKFSFTGQDGKTVYAVSRRVAKKARSCEHKI
jgi:hypothetical protein